MRRSDADTLISCGRLLEIIPLSRSQIWRLEQAGAFPRRLRVGRRKIAWRMSDINEWISTRAPLDIGEDGHE
jgi:predicted DNA-binding transcriptional regulator AlpA